MVAGNKQDDRFYSAHIKVEFIVDLGLLQKETKGYEFFQVYYKFPTKDFPNWKKLSHHEAPSSEFFDDLKQACITQKMEEQ